MSYKISTILAGSALTIIFIWMAFVGLMFGMTVALVAIDWLSMALLEFLRWVGGLL